MATSRSRAHAAGCHGSIDPATARGWWWAGRGDIVGRIELEGRGPTLTRKLDGWFAGSSAQECRRGSSWFVKSESGSRIGGVPERPKGTDCKSVGEAFGGSNPPPSTIQLII